jgi:transposase
MPRADTQARPHHLDESARNLAPKAHAPVVLDQAGWHTTGKLHVPDNLSVLPLPPKSPELNPTENVWQFLRQNKLSNRIFGDDNAIVTAACEAWNSLPRRSRPHRLNRNPPLRHYRWGSVSVRV